MPGRLITCPCCINEYESGTPEYKRVRSAFDLVASAPTLLAALRDIKHILESVNEPRELKHDPCYQKAVAAIAKAEGKS